MIYKKTILIMSLIFVAVTLFSGNVNANLALGFPYEVSGSPGQTFESTISLQNTIAPSSDIQVEITIVKGSEYVSFPQGTIINLSANETKNIQMTVSIPSNAKAEKRYPVSLLFKQTDNDIGSQGMIGMSITISKDFDIIVKGEEKSNNIIVIISTILIILIIILTGLLIKTLKAKKN